MQNKEAIAALQEELRGLRQGEHYWPEHQRITREINRLQESQPSNFYSPEPTPEQSKLVVLKNRVLFALEPYRFRVAGKDWNALLIALKFATDSNQVETLYSTWQGKLRLKNIADLPDLNAKPKLIKASRREAA